MTFTMVLPSAIVRLFLTFTRSVGHPSQIHDGETAGDRRNPLRSDDPLWYSISIILLVSSSSKEIVIIEINLWVRVLHPVVYGRQAERQGGVVGVRVSVPEWVRMLSPAWVRTAVPFRVRIWVPVLVRMAVPV